MNREETVRSRERHRKLSEIFAATFELEGAARREALAEACGDDAELRAEVEAMLESHEERKSFLGTPALGRGLDLPEPGGSDRGDGSLVGRSIGGCLLQRLIGSGGMGTVYEARQENPQRTVAVKVLRAGHASRSALRRFEYEAQVLGQLSHPGIAQVFEAGTYDDGDDSSRGRPYFVMEFIANALPVTRYASANDLGFDERLDLFSSICDAVQHGHQKGIIHRDLKPDNILVDEHGQPKIIDFGVARATDADLRLTTMRTDVGQLIGTLQYMSPEQCAADPRELDTRSDVYSLGLLLYELLCDRLPYDVSQLAIHEAVQVIQSGASTRLGVTDRSLRGDLDTITAKALEKDPERRYTTAAELGQDVRRYLGHEPILARPPSAIYQIRKFARRNRTLVGGVAAVFVALVLGLVGTSWQAVQAEQARAAEARERKKAERETAVKTAVYEFMHQTLTGFTAPEEELTVREMLDRAAVTIESAYRDDPQVEADVRDMIQDMYRVLGRYDLAEPHVIRMVELLESELGPDHESTLGAQVKLTFIWRQLGRAAEGEALLLHILEQRRSRLGNEDELTIYARSELAMNYQAEGRLEEAEPMMREVVRDNRRLLDADDPALIASLNNHALMLSDGGQVEEALEIFTDLERQDRESGAEPTVNSARRSLNLADALKASGRMPEAAEKYSEVLELRQQILGPGHPETFRAYYLLAWVYQDMHEYDRSLAVYDEYLSAQREEYGDRHAEVAATLHHKAQCLMQAGQWKAAEALAYESMEMYHSLPEAPPGEYRHATEAMYTILRSTGTPRDRVTMLREALAYQRGNVEPGHVELNYAMFFLGFELLRGGEHAEAELLLGEALEIAERHWLPGSPNYWEVGNTMRLLGSALFEGGRYEEAEPLLRDSHELLGEQDFTAPNQAAGRECLIRLYEAWDKPEQAEIWRAKRPGAHPDRDR